MEVTILLNEDMIAKLEAYRADEIDNLNSLLVNRKEGESKEFLKSVIAVLQNDTIETVLTKYLL